MFNILLEDAAPKGMGDYWWVYLILIVLILAMMVVPMFSQRKRMKEYNNMIDQVGVGDTVRTIGGVIGRITKIKEQDGYKTILLETGEKGNKTVMEYDIASIAVVLKSVNQPAAPAGADAQPAKQPEAQAPVAEEPAKEEDADTKEIEDAVHGKTASKPAKTTAAKKPAAKKPTGKSTSKKK